MCIHINVCVCVYLSVCIRTMLNRISSVASSRNSSAVGRTPRSEAFVHHAKQMVA